MTSFTNSSTDPSALTSSSLNQITGSVSVPNYDRTALSPSIVHIGVGGFHRAHLATYVDDLCGTGHTDWAIVGSGILPHDKRMADTMAAQEGLYTLINRGTHSTEVEVIGSIISYIHAHPDPTTLIERIADPATQIVSMTITEGGYPVDDVTGEFAADAPTAGPGSAFDILAQALELRRKQSGAPISVVSCDNMMSNGKVTRTATLGEAARISPQLVSWIESSVSFPNSMVDRITPATKPADCEWLSTTHGINDQWPVVAEPFRQWVIEDDFAGARLPLEEIDVIVTDNVEPYEFMKLRLLNAGHSALAYLAALCGIGLVDQAIADPHIREFVNHLLHDEAKPVLPEVAGIDVDTYIDQLIGRFLNPAIGDQISRLCLDGSAKFPKFLLPTIRAELAAGGSIELSALALAGWCEYLTGGSDEEVSIELSSDPQLEAAVGFASQSLTRPAAFLEFASVFGDDLPRSDRFVKAFEGAVELLRTVGVRSAIEIILEKGRSKE